MNKFNSLYKQISVKKRNIHQFKFEVSFNLPTEEGEELDKYSVVVQFKNELLDFVKRYALEEGTFYTHSGDSEGQAYPTNIKVKNVPLT
jgi:uncharacterized protein involved in type VI secretion and phage assembly